MFVIYRQPDDKDQHPIYYKYILAYICGGAALIGVFGILIIRPFVHNDPQRGKSYEKILKLRLGNI